MQLEPIPPAAKWRWKLSLTITPIAGLDETRLLYKRKKFFIHTIRPYCCLYCVSPLLPPRNLPLICSSSSSCCSTPSPLSSRPCSTAPPPLGGKTQPQSYSPFFYILHRPSSIIPWNYLFPCLQTPNPPISGPFPCKITLLNPRPHRQQFMSEHLPRRSKSMGGNSRNTYHLEYCYWALHYVF